jgi:uncharacterized membrane protein
METTGIIIGLVLIVAFLGYWLGKSKQKSKQDKHNAEELHKDAKVDNRPDVDRDSLYKGLRGD